MHISILPRLVACVLVAASASTTPIEDAEASGPARIRIELIRSVGGEILGSHSVRLYATPDAGPSHLRSGLEVPVGDEYRNVGLSLTCRVTRRDSHYVVRIALDRSELVPTGGLPSFQTYNVTGEVELAPGETKELLSSSASEDDENHAVRVTLEP